MNLPYVSINDTVGNYSVKLQDLLIIMGTAILTAILVSLTYILTHKKTGFSMSVIASIMLIGPISSVIILVVGNSLARAVSVGGGIAFIRYRTTLESPSDLAYIFMSLAFGMAAGVGCCALAIVACVILCLIAIILRLVNLPSFSGTSMTLKVLIPESLNYYGLYDDILKKYCKSFRLRSIKTADYGTLFEMTYKIKMKDPASQKEFIDDIRTRNGNLTVTLTQQLTEEQ